MLRTFLCATALLAMACTASTVYASCGQVSDVSAARLRWERVRQNSGNPAQHEESCRAYSTLFLEAVKTRQVASICEEGPGRQRDLDMLDAEIDAFNNLIAAQCRGS
jgi:hypothetical protein